MQALILTAGFGRRMRPFTDNTHKTLLKIGDKTVIEWIIDALVVNNINRITIVTGYREQQLRMFLLRRYPQLEFAFVHNERYRETNNIFSMALAFEQMVMDDDVLLIESDLIFDPVVITRLLESPHKNIALVDYYRQGMDGTVVTVEQEIITSIIPPHLQSVNFDFSDKYKTLNIYRFSKQLAQGSFGKLLQFYANTIDQNCYYELILGLLIYMGKETIHADILQGERWAEIDDPNDLRIARYLFEEEQRKPILDSGYGGFWHYDVIDFCYIRNMYFPSNAIHSELRNNLLALTQNYGSCQAILNQKLAYFLLCDVKPLTLLNGASQIFPVLTSFFASQRILLPEPTFGEYYRAFPEANHYRDQVGIDLPEFLVQMANVDVIVIVNPNNPTGTTWGSEALMALAAQNSEKTFIVDESFIEFSGEVSIVSLLETKPLTNIIVIKSLSKSLGIPGLRLGYCYSHHQSFKAYLQAGLPIWNSNSIAEFFLEIILKHRTSLEQAYSQTIADREQFGANLAQLPAVQNVYASGANFLLVALRADKENSNALVEHLLKEHKIYVKDISDRFTDGRLYLRFAVRLPEENQHLLNCLTSTYHTLIGASS